MLFSKNALFVANLSENFFTLFRKQNILLPNRIENSKDQRDHIVLSSIDLWFPLKC